MRGGQALRFRLRDLQAQVLNWQAQYQMMRVQALSGRGRWRWRARWKCQTLLISNALILSKVAARVGFERAGDMEMARQVAADMRAAGKHVPPATSPTRQQPMLAPIRPGLYGDQGLMVSGPVLIQS